MTRGSPSYDEKEKERERARKRERQGKKGLDEMPVKRREIVVRGKGDDDLVLHPETIVNYSRTDADGWRKRAGAACCTPLPVSYIIRPSFFFSFLLD